MEEAEEGSLTSGYWSLTRHSKEESVDKAAVAGEEGERSGGSATAAALASRRVRRAQLPDEACVLINEELRLLWSA